MIKKVAAVLFSLILLQVHAFALVGGPWDSEINVFGTYSAVLIPVSAGDIESLPIDDPSRNSIGLFVIAVPAGNFAQGYAVVFQDGLAFVGEAVGIGDPDSGRITGVMEARFISSAGVTEDGGQVLFIGGVASGAFKTNFVATERNSFSSTSFQRIEGNATIQVVQPDEFGSPIITSTVDYIVDGYKSSNNTAVGSLTVPSIGLSSVVNGN